MEEGDYPALYIAANTASVTAQNHFFISLFLSLSFLVVAAVLSVTSPPSVAGAIAQACVLSLSLASTIYLGTQRPERIWYGARALAESVKTISWRYMSRAAPYNIRDSESRANFVSALKELLLNNRDISKLISNPIEGIESSDFIHQARLRSFSERKSFYREHRVSNQLAWYAKKARFHKLRANIFFTAICIANALAIFFAILRIHFNSTPFWPTEIFVALAAVLIAWTQSKRYRELTTSYSFTAHEISLIREQLHHVNSEDQFSEFVGDAENAFSREHTQWLARRDA